LAKTTKKELSLRSIFDRTMQVFIAAAVVLGIACWLVLGRQEFFDSFKSDFALLLFMMPKFAAAMLVAAFVQVLLPRDKVARYVSDEAGAKGLVIATAVGALTPGGPMTSFPIVRALREAGTGRGALFAYLTSWSTLGFQRILSWEVPLLGIEFAAIRFVASLPLPFIAGVMQRWLPKDRVPDEREELRAEPVAHAPASERRRDV
jgi:uncharacterized membrane protein YraQ (UPF0718 family)